jgi:hypothetical protein
MLPRSSIAIPSGYSFAPGSRGRTVVSGTVAGVAASGVARPAATAYRHAIPILIGTPCWFRFANEKS